MTDMIAIPTITSAIVYADCGGLEFTDSGTTTFIAFSVSFILLDRESARGLPSRFWQDSVAK